MRYLAAQRAAFAARKTKEHLEASQRAALQLLCGIDIDATLASSASAILQTTQILRRMIARERLKGLSGHWSYDLNRHIALKQAHDRLVKAAISKAVEE